MNIDASVCRNSLPEHRPKRDRLSSRAAGPKSRRPPSNRPLPSGPHVRPTRAAG